MSWDELKQSFASSEPSPHAGAYNYVYAFAELDAMLFESEDNLKSVMKMVSNILKPGGLFIGSFLDSSELFTKLVKQHQHGKSSFTLSKNLATFDFDPQVASSILNPASSKRFGLSFTFTIEEQQRKMNLIHTPSFLEEATRSGFELVDIPNSAEYFEEAKRNHPDLRKAIPSAKPTNPQQAKSSLIVLPEQKEVLGMCFSLFSPPPPRRKAEFLSSFSLCRFLHHFYPSQIVI